MTLTTPPVDRLAGVIQALEPAFRLDHLVALSLLGRPPFEGLTPETILARQMTDDLPPLHEARPDVPREVEEVLRRALASDPARRYASAQAFRDALNRATGGFWRRLRAL